MVRAATQEWASMPCGRLERASVGVIKQVDKDGVYAANGYK